MEHGPLSRRLLTATSVISLAGTLVVPTAEACTRAVYLGLWAVGVTSLILTIQLIETNRVST